MSGSKTSSLQSNGIPQLPARAEELFRTVFSWPMTESTPHPPPLVISEANAYRTYVQQLALRLNHELRHLLLTIQNEAELVRVNQELLQIERNRHAALQPYLTTADESSKTADTTQSKSGWYVLQHQLREQITKELEVVRDARVRLEFRRAELINQRPGIRARIVLCGGAQIKVHFGRRAGHATEKT